MYRLGLKLLNLKLYLVTLNCYLVTLNCLLYGSRLSNGWLQYRENLEPCFLSTLSAYKDIESVRLVHYIMMLGDANSSIKIILGFRLAIVASWLVRTDQFLELVQVALPTKYSGRFPASINNIELFYNVAG